MKIQWTPELITVGLYFYRKGENISTVSQIGYLHSCADSEAEPKYTAISMSDGCIWQPHTAEQLAKALTSGNYIPVPKDTLIKFAAERADAYNQAFFG